MHTHIYIYIYIYSAHSPVKRFYLFVFGYSEWAATCKFATGMGTMLVR
jgi:hypothetical protein